MRAGGHALRGLGRGEEGAHREAAADALGDGHDVRRDTGPFMRPQPAGPPHAALDLVEEQEQVELVRDLAKLAQEVERPRADAPLAPHPPHAAPPRACRYAGPP